MSTEMKKRPPVGLVSAAIYVSLATAAAGAFLVAASAIDNHSAVARLGGASWVFLLSLIILMPTITPVVKRLFTAR